MKTLSLQDSKFIDKFTEFAAKLGSQVHLSSLRDAFATIMPLYILAGLAVLLNNTVYFCRFCKKDVVRICTQLCKCICRGKAERR